VGPSFAMAVCARLIVSTPRFARTTATTSRAPATCSAARAEPSVAARSSSPSALRRAETACGVGPFSVTRACAATKAS